MRPTRFLITSSRVGGRRRRDRSRGIVRRVFASWLAASALLAATDARPDELQDVGKLVSNGDLDTAERRADAFLAQTPKDAQMRFLKGVILAQRGRRDDAIAMFDGLTQDFPELPEPYNNMAVIYAARGDYDRARATLESAVRVAPNYATAYENLGDVYAALAARAYQDSRRNDPNNAAALRKLNASRALLTMPAGAAAVSSASTVPAAVTPVAVRPSVTTSQRNIGLPSPAGPRVTVGGFGATSPEIVVPLDSVSVPEGSNVVAVETAAVSDPRQETTPLNGVVTRVASDPAQPIDAVTAAVRRWASGRSVTADALRIRVDGDTAVARFRETDASPLPGKPGQPRPSVERALTLRSDGGSWTVVDSRVEP